MENTVDIPDILNADLSTVTTTYPVLPVGVYEMRITEMKVVAGKDQTKQTKNLEFVLETLVPLQDVEGKAVPVGHKITDRFSLTLTEKYTKEMLDRRLKQVIESVWGKDAARATFGSPSEYIGQTAVVRLAIEKDKDGVYDPKNKVVFVPRR